MLAAASVVLFLTGATRGLSFSLTPLTRAHHTRPSLGSNVVNGVVPQPHGSQHGRGCAAVARGGGVGWGAGARTRGLTRRWSAGDGEDNVTENMEDDITKAFFETVRSRLGDDFEAVMNDPRSEVTEEMTREFFDVVQQRTSTGGKPGETSSLSDGQIYNELAKRQGFARISKMLTQAIRNRKDAKNILKEAIRSVPGVMGTDDDQPGTMLYLPEDRQNMAPTDVITTVLEALQTNDQPRPNHGIQLLLSFMSDASSFGAVSDEAKFVEYINESDYSVLLYWEQLMFAGKLEVSLDGVKAYQSIKLRDSRTGQWSKVKWTLEKNDGAWFVVNMLVSASKRG